KKASKKDDASQSSKTSRSSTRSSGSSSASRTSALRKTFTTLARELTTLAEGEDNSDITDSEEESATTHFTWLDEVPAVEKTFTTSDASQCTGVDMRNVILLDNQSTIDLFCNPDLVQDITETKSTVQVKSTGGKLRVTEKATLPGYHRKVWYSSGAITN
ncbi:MAG: hypothetical protein ACRCZI_02765, partial [Cetobacterium sp.]